MRIVTIAIVRDVYDGLELLRRVSSCCRVQRRVRRRHGAHRRLLQHKHAVGDAVRHRCRLLLLLMVMMMRQLQVEQLVFDRERVGRALVQNSIGVGAEITVVVVVVVAVVDGRHLVDQAVVQCHALVAELANGHLCLLQLANCEIATQHTN